MVNKRAVLINGIIAAAVAVILIGMIMLGMYLHSRVLDTDLHCSGMDNYRYTGLKRGMTMKEVVNLYGEFDKVFDTIVYPDGSGYQNKVGYIVSSAEAGYRYTKYPVYLVLTFDTDGKLSWCQQEVRAE